MPPLIPGRILTTSAAFSPRSRVVPLSCPRVRRLAPGRRRTLSPAVTAGSTQAKGRFVATPRPLALAGTSWPLPRKPCAGGGSALSGTARDRPRTFFCFGSQVNRAWIDLAAPRKVPDEAVISRSVQIHGPRRQKRRCVPWDMPLTHNGTDTRTSICDYSVSLWRTGHACRTGFLRRAGLSPPVCAMGVTVPSLHASEGCQDD